mgnify:CR=1 FL=1
MRGEDMAIVPRYMRILGSPPHARGRPWEEITTTRNPGITPACAGKTRRAARPGGRTSDHPRMRGEDTSTTWRMTGLSGSPPHARGRLLKLIFVLLLSGITPACAGKTARDESVVRLKADHPRMRGEDLLL